MMFGLRLLAYPWDLLDDDLAAVVDRLAGEIGIQGLSVWMAAPPTRELRARRTQPRTLHQRGGYLFQPSDRFFGQLRRQPVVSSWLRAGNPFAEIAEACSKHGLELRAVVSASATGLLAERYPELACRNAFGDESRTAVCLANAEIQAMLSATVANLSARDGLGGLVLTDFAIGWREALDDGLRLSVSLGSVERSLLATCFCDSCRREAQRAGADSQGAAEAVVRVLQKTMEQGRAFDDDGSAFFTDQPILSAYRRSQTGALNAALLHVKQACRCPLWLSRNPADLSGAIAVPDCALADGTVTRVNEPTEWVSANQTGAPRCEIELSASTAVGTDGSRLVGLLPEMARAGLAGATLDHYGLLPDAALATLRQAMRFTRRATGP